MQRSTVFLKVALQYKKIIYIHDHKSYLFIFLVIIYFFVIKGAIFASPCGPFSPFFLHPPPRPLQTTILFYLKVKTNKFLAGTTKVLTGRQFIALLYRGVCVSNRDVD